MRFTFLDIAKWYYVKNDVVDVDIEFIDDKSVLIIKTIETENTRKTVSETISSRTWDYIADSYIYYH